MASGERIASPGSTSTAGFNGVIPDSPAGYAEIDPSMYDAHARLAHLDREGIYANVSYPNVGGFGNATFLRLGERGLVDECLSAFNDFMADWCSADPDRLIVVMSTPFWDVEFVVRENSSAAPPSATAPLTSATRPTPSGTRASSTRTGTDLGRGTGGRHADQLPRRRRRHRPLPDGPGPDRLPVELRQGGRRR